MVVFERSRKVQRKGKKEKAAGHKVKVQAFLRGRHPDGGTWVRKVARHRAGLVREVWILQCSALQRMWHTGWPPSLEWVRASFREPVWKTRGCHWQLCLNGTSRFFTSSNTPHVFYSSYWFLTNTKNGKSCGCIVKYVFSAAFPPILVENLNKSWWYRRLCYFHNCTPV